MSSPAQAQPALRVQGLGVRYGALVALDDVAWEVHPGELLGIIGPNGAGKSSCYDAVTALVSRLGSVWLQGRDVSQVAVKMHCNDCFGFRCNGPGNFNWIQAP